MSWYLINKEDQENTTAISYKEIVGEDYNLIDIRRINGRSEKVNLCIYIIGKKTKQFIFNNPQEALNHLFKLYPILKNLK